MDKRIVIGAAGVGLAAILTVATVIGVSSSRKKTDIAKDSMTEGSSCIASQIESETIDGNVKDSTSPDTQIIAQKPETEKPVKEVPTTEVNSEKHSTQQDSEPAEPSKPAPEPTPEPDSSSESEKPAEQPQPKPEPTQEPEPEPEPTPEPEPEEPAEKTWGEKKAAAVEVSFADFKGYKKPYECSEEEFYKSFYQFEEMNYDFENGIDCGTYEFGVLTERWLYSDDGTRKVKVTGYYTLTEPGRPCSLEFHSMLFPNGKYGKEYYDYINCQKCSDTNSRIQFYFFENID